MLLVGGFTLEQRHLVSVTCAVVCSYPEPLAPDRGGDQLSEEVAED